MVVRSGGQEYSLNVNNMYISWSEKNIVIENAPSEMILPQCVSGMK